MRFFGPNFAAFAFEIEGFRLSSLGLDVRVGSLMFGPVGFQPVSSPLRRYDLGLSDPGT